MTFGLNYEQKELAKQELEKVFLIILMWSNLPYSMMNSVDLRLLVAVEFFRPSLTLSPNVWSNINCLVNILMLTPLHILDLRVPSCRVKKGTLAFD